MFHQRLFLAALLLATCAANTASAITYDWNNAAGGTFNTTTNWTPNGVPSTNDTARFGINNIYAIAFSNSASFNTFTQTQGDATLNLSNKTLLASSTTNNSMGAAGFTSTLRLNTGSFLPGGFTIGSVATSTSNLYLDTGLTTTVGFGPFYVGSSGTGNLWLQNGASLATNSGGAAIGVNSGGVGTATVIGSSALGTASAWTIGNTPLRVGSSGTGTLNILSGGTVTAFALEVGENLGSNGTISLSGLGATLTVNTGIVTGAGIANIGGNLSTAPAASATLNIGTGATMNLNGTTNFRTNARVNVNGGTLNLATVTVASGALFNWTSGTINFATGPTITPSILDLLLSGTHTLGTNRTLSATAGTITITSPTTLTGGSITAPNLDLNANIDIGAFSSIAATNTVTLEPGKTIQVGDFATLGATTSITNSGGTLELEGPLANVTGPVANNAGFIRGTGRFTAGLNNGANGTIRAETGDHLIIDTVGPTNLGTIELAGGTVEYSKTLSNLAGGTISGRGIFRGSSSTPGSTGITNQGVMSFSAGISDVYGDVNNITTGQIIVGGASTVTFYDDVVNNGTEIRTVTGSRSVFFGAVSGAGPFTGGGTVELDGDLKPGNSPANVTFGGNVVVGPTAATNIELAGTTKGAQYDSLTVTGGVSLSGALDVVLLNGFNPSPGQSFNIMTAAGGIDGTFDSTNLPALAGGLYFNIAYAANTVTLSVAGILGDYNKNGTLDASDYVLWRKTVSQSGSGLAADGNHNGIIDPADFEIWRNSYGTTAGTGAGANVTANIPEPTSLLMLVIAIANLTLLRRCAPRLS